MVGRWELERRYAAHSGCEGSKSADVSRFARAASARSALCNLDVGWIQHSVRGDTVGGAGNQ
jgi:hypothetical protein